MILLSDFFFSKEISLYSSAAANSEWMGSKNRYRFFFFFCTVVLQYPGGLVSEMPPTQIPKYTDAQVAYWELLLWLSGNEPNYYP